MRNLALSLCAPLLLLACGGRASLEPPLTESVDALRAALEARDFDKLWALTDQETQKNLLAAFADADRARALVPSVWAEADREAANAALGSALATAIGPNDDQRGPRILAATLDPSVLAFNEGTVEGFAPRDVTFDPGPPRRAIVATAAGERLTFVDEAGQWKSLLVRDQVFESAAMKSLIAHARKTNALADEQQRVWQASLDPKTPQGAYNLARAAQDRKPPDVDMLFALLDEDARKALVDILEGARAAQKQIQQRTAKAMRREAYRAAGLLALVDTTTDRELFRRWATSPDFKPLLTATDPAVSLEGDPATGSATVVTTSGARIPMHRDADAFWRLSGLRAILTAALGPHPTGNEPPKTP
jgi:hypothetical protein